MLGISISLWPLGAAPAEEGGGGEPEPSLAASNFKDGEYSIAMVSKSLAEMWESDPDWSPFNASTVIADEGLVAGNDNTNATPAASAALRTAVFDGFTMVINLLFPVDENDGNCAIYFEAMPSFSPEKFISFTTTRLNPGNPQVTVGKGTGGTGNLQTEGIVDGANRIAVTVTNTAVSVSLNGGAVATVADAIALTDFDHMSLNPLRCTVEDMTIVEAVDDADLPTLST